MYFIFYIVIGKRKMFCIFWFNMEFLLDFVVLNLVVFFDILNFKGIYSYINLIDFFLL